MNVERTCRWTKMRRFRVQFRSAVTLPPTLFLADYIIDIAGFEFSTGTGWSFKHDRRVMELAKASKTLEEIAKTMNRAPDRIRKVAMWLGVSVKSKAPKK
jgi:hypothetical protein